ncbi:hypothetical protein Tco_1358702 [Tanacetum coccineum]
MRIAFWGCYNDRSARPKVARSDSAICHDGGRETLRVKDEELRNLATDVSKFMQLILSRSVSGRSSNVQTGLKLEK